MVIEGRQAGGSGRSEASELAPSGFTSRRARCAKVEAVVPILRPDAVTSSGLLEKLLAAAGHQRPVRSMLAGRIS